MYISKQTGYALVVRDYLEESFIYHDGSNYTFKGTISLFTEYPPSVNTEEFLPVIKRAIADIDDEVKVEKTAAGIRMTMTNLKFKPNSSELLAGQEANLSKIAQVLLKSPDNQILVEGHTASTGQPNAEMKLSVEIANAVAMSLARLGVSQNRFICQGRGSTRPVADNSTPKGKAQNRRVEITILSN